MVAPARPVITRDCRAIGAAPVAATTPFRNPRRPSLGSILRLIGVLPQERTFIHSFENQDAARDVSARMRRGLTGERAAKMKQRRGRLLEHFCRSLNENVTRIVWTKFCARTQSDRRDEMWTKFMLI